MKATVSVRELGWQWKTEKDGSERGLEGSEERESLGGPLGHLLGLQRLCWRHGTCAVICSAISFRAIVIKTSG